jgi:hypothetical protein
MKHKENNILHNEDLSLLMKLTLGAAVVSMVTSFSTHHITIQGHSQKPVTVADIGHFMEREREVMHNHSSLGRVRYPAVSGN